MRLMSQSYSRFPVQHHHLSCIRSRSLCGPRETGIVLHKHYIIVLVQVPSHVFSKVPVTFVFGINRINSLEKVNSEEEEKKKTNKNPLSWRVRVVCVTQGPGCLNHHHHHSLRPVSTCV